MSKKSEVQPEGRVTIGKIVGVHGVGGTMLILPLTDYPERFFKMRKLTLEKPGVPSQTVNVKSIFPYEGKDTLFLRLENVTDRTSAEAFRGSVITVSKEERIGLSDDEYWIDDIIGIRVLDSTSRRELGILEEVMQTGSNDVYLVRTAEGQLKPIPALAEAIISVDTEEGVMLAAVPEGLWD